MNKHPTALMMSLLVFFMAIIGLTHLQNVGKYILLVVLVVGVVAGWVVYFNLLSEALGSVQ